MGGAKERRPRLRGRGAKERGPRRAALTAGPPLIQLALRMLNVVWLGQFQIPDPTPCGR